MLNATEFAEVGAWVWIRGASEEAILDGRAKGGVIYKISEDLNPETGELSKRLHLIRRDGKRLRFAHLTEPEVGTVELPNVRDIRSIIRAGARQLADGRGPFASDDQDLVEVIRRLAEVAW